MASIPMPHGLILAGGRSSRMGEHKPGLTIGRRTLLEHIVARLAPQVSSLLLNAPEDTANPPGLPLLPDRFPAAAGPLAGVLTGLRHLIAEADNHPTHMLSVPGDGPFLPLDLALRLGEAAHDAQAIAVAASAGRSHPVFALWPLAIADDLEAWLADPENRRMQMFLRRHKTVTVEFAMIPTPEGDLDPFFNINTPEDLHEARRFAGILAP